MMTKRDFFDLLLKILGLYLLIQIVFPIKELIALFLFSSNPLIEEASVYTGYMGLVLFHSLFLIVAAAILLLRSERISAWIIKNNTTLNISIDKEFLIELVVLTIGLYYFINAIPHLIENSYNYYYRDKEEINFPLGQRLNFYYSLTQTIVSLLLILGRKNISRFLYRKTGVLIE